MTSGVAHYGHVLADYSGQGHLRLETGEKSACAFTVGQLADGQIILLTDRLEVTWWLSNERVSFEGTTSQGEQVIALGGGLQIGDLRPSSAIVGPVSLAFDLPWLTARAVAAWSATEARFGVTNFILAQDTYAALSLHAPTAVVAAQLVAVPDVKDVALRIRTLRAIDVTCELRVPLDQGVSLEVVREAAHTLCRALSIANGSRVEWIYCDLHDAHGNRVERQHRNHVTKRYTGWPVIDHRNGWTSEAQRFAQEAFRILATNAEPLLRPAIIEALLDAKAQEDFLEARGVKVAVTLEMLRAALVSPQSPPETSTHIKTATFDKLLPRIRTAVVAVDAILAAGGVPPETRAKMLEDRSLRQLNRIRVKRDDFRHRLGQLRDRVGLAVDDDTIHRVAVSRHALVHEGKFYCQLRPNARSARLPPLPHAADEYYFLLAFVDRLILKLLRYQGSYLDWNISAGQQPRSAILT